MTDLTPILQAVRQASVLCRRVQETHFVRSEKGANDPVTIADYGAQIIIQRALSQHFPDDAIISEEQSSQFLEILNDEQRAEILRLLSDILGENITQDDAVRWLDQGSGRTTTRTWVIDPVDGTKGFIGMRRYSIAVGVLENGKVVDGILGSPGHPTPDGLGMIFYTRNGMAFVEPMTGGEARPIHVSDTSDIAAARVVESVVPAHADLEQMARIREAAGILGDAEQVDSQEKYAMVASGEADLYMRLPRSSKDRHWIWDHAAGTAIVEAAGGKVSDVDGSPLDFSLGTTLARNQGMVVSNGRIHERVLEAVQQVRSAI
jgi:HAL2 family 3'(2'),5'-bisphosphate nucleotidase